MGGFADRQTCTLKYTSLFRLDTAGSGITAKHSFLGNSVFDPDFTGVGSQPMNFDAWSGIYQHYMVWGSTIVVKATAITEKSGTLLCVVPTRDPATSGIIEASIERPRAKVRMLTFQGRSSYIKSKVSTAAMLPLFNSRLLSETTTNPADVWFWHITTQAVDSASEESVVDVMVELYYNVTFYERKIQVRS